MTRNFRYTRAMIGVVAGAAIAAGLLLMALTAMAANQAVTVKGFAFNPASIQVTVGDSITWTNQDSAPHTVTADGGAFDKPLAANGGTATITFNTAGTFPYHCTIHPNMHGTVVVLAAATSTASPSAGASATASAAPSVVAPATGSGAANPGQSWAPILALIGGLLVAAGVGGGVLAVTSRR